MRENSTSTNRRVELASKDGEITAAPIQRKSSRASRSAAKPIPKEAIESDTAVTKLPSRGKVASKKGQNSATLEAAIDAKTTTTDKKRGKGPANAKAAARAVKEEGDAELESKVTKAVEKKRKTAKDEEVVPPDDKSDKPKKRRKTKEDKEAEAMPLAARTQGLRMHIGAHVSSAKGVQNAVTNAVHIGGNGFALFLKSQRKWQNPPLNPEQAVLFKQNCREHGFDAAKHVLPHGSYLVNLAQKEADKAAQAYDCFIEDLQRCETLGIKLYNFHPGSTGPHPRPEAIGRIAAALNKAHRSTRTVTTVLENMAGTGNVIGSRWEDLRDIIALVDDKTRVGVCLDTCHAFAAGHDLRTAAALNDTLAAFDRTVGLRFLRALHLNDSKAPFRSHRDLHANIGTGFLGLRAFHAVVNEPRFEDLPMLLETPTDRDGKEDKNVWATEIKLLEGLIGLDPEGKAFKEQEQRLADQGREMREKHRLAFERKAVKQSKDKDKKGLKAGAKGKANGTGKKGQESSASEDDSDDDE